MALLVIDLLVIFELSPVAPDLSLDDLPLLLRLLWLVDPDLSFDWFEEFMPVLLPLEASSA